ncbi:non-heme iron oxygenase ferredoxin subunit [Streptomyces sp. NPDC005373]|uniref:non-heme iron oxygenase ferredoxin subunit n=1 Tax=Streptomyces sp. NPDC005373 TaxID=3156879 RepID=UPI0033BEA84A
MTWVRACALGEVDPGDGFRWTPPEREPIAIFLVEGQVHAIDDTCSHGQASLADEGYLDGRIVECGLHQGTFDVCTGKAMTWPCTLDLRTYPTRLDGDDVLVDLTPKEN